MILHGLATMDQIYVIFINNKEDLRFVLVFCGFGSVHGWILAEMDLGKYSLQACVKSEYGCMRRRNATIEDSVTTPNLISSHPYLFP